MKELNGTVVTIENENEAIEFYDLCEKHDIPHRSKLWDRKCRHKHEIIEFILNTNKVVIKYDWYESKGDVAYGITTRTTGTFISLEEFKEILEPTEDTDRNDEKRNDTISIVSVLFARNGEIKNTFYTSKEYTEEQLIGNILCCDEKVKQLMNNGWVVHTINTRSEKL